MDDQITRIYLKDVGKKFNLNLAHKESALFSCVNLFKQKMKSNDFWALKNINLSPFNGKIQGVIGRNGSGKSTLLKVIAGIYRPDAGELKINGDIVYLSGFGQGIMPKLTMRENIFLIGTLLGLNKKEITEKYDEIVDFSDLKNYQNAKVYQFSSGMISRLTFSTTIFCIKHKNPEIILIDEALDAGADLTFKEKALKKLDELILCGANVLMVSHNLDTINKYCEHIIWMENGEIFKRGSAQQIIPEYIASCR